MEPLVKSEIQDSQSLKVSPTKFDLVSEQSKSRKIQIQPQTDEFKKYQDNSDAQDIFKRAL